MPYVDLYSLVYIFVTKIFIFLHVAKTLLYCIVKFFITCLKNVDIRVQISDIKYMFILCSTIVNWILKLYVYFYLFYHWDIREDWTISIHFIALFSCRVLLGLEYSSQAPSCDKLIADYWNPKWYQMPRRQSGNTCICLFQTQFYFDFSFCS